MDMRTLRRRCEARLRNLPLPNPFDIERFVASIGERRGRPILVIPHALGGGLTGMWVGGDDMDLIFYDRDAQPDHRLLIILHELAHILCGHQGVPLAAVAVLVGLSPPSPHGLQRTMFMDDDEREAEMMASLIAWRVARMLPLISASDIGTAAALRLAAELEGEG